MQTDLMDRLRWLRVVGDTIFAVGIIGLGWFVLGLKTGWSVIPEGVAERAGGASSRPLPGHARPTA